MLAILQDDLTIHDDQRDPSGMRLRLLISRLVRQVLHIQNDQIGSHPVLQSATIIELR